MTTRLPGRPVGYDDVLATHPALAVLGDGEKERLWHVVDDWEEPVPDTLLAGVLRQLTRARVVRGALVDAGVTATADAHRILGDLTALRDQQILLERDDLSGLAAHGPTMWGVPAATLGAALAERVDVAVMGLPYDLGTTTRSGAREAPEAIRRWSGTTFSFGVDEHGHPTGAWDPTRAVRVLAGVRMVDLGDVPAPVVDRDGVGLDRLERWCERLAAAGVVPVVLGGDHSIAAPASAGVARSLGPIGVVQLDAHGDRGGQAGERREMHHGNMADWIAEDPRVASLVQVGVRQRSTQPPPEHPDVTVVAGRPGILDQQRVLAEMSPDLPWYVTIDVDVLDPAALPSTGSPVPGGPTAPELLSLLHSVAHERRIVGVDLCELSPGPGPEDPMLAAELLVTVLAGATGRPA